MTVPQRANMCVHVRACVLACACVCARFSVLRQGLGCMCSTCMRVCACVGGPSLSCVRVWAQTHPCVFVTLQPWLGCAQAMLDKYAVEHCLRGVTAKKQLFRSVSDLELFSSENCKFSFAHLAVFPLHTFLQRFSIGQPHGHT